MIKNWFSELFRPIEEEGPRAFFPNRNFKETVKEIIKLYVLPWATAGAIMYIFGFSLSLITSNDYFCLAAIEILSLKLWNTTSSLGIVIITASGLLFHIYKQVSDRLFHLGCRLLRFCSELGAMAFGTFIAMFLIALLYTDFAALKSYLATFISLLLIITLFIINMIVWWARYCTEEKVSKPTFLLHIRDNRSYMALFGSIVIAIFIIALLFSESSTTSNTMCVFT
ncbi:hypothetical protein KZO85_03580 [Chromohalobacter canadensis]|uniref:hypothetical protein n=1 Tax=Chromohalobacter canadensis TaxID=141389 RepID=UPI0021BF73A1|nr:hypothetical protein [Chromohalobacter canadensis]MCT8467655.1 hypothetical protein [Chromohalobacter canadensis]MCT8470597.1 hypothetical protein [Chromohalobacter canadensis]MCT8498152.1 hypothetical protein [Chromohalobacter canadensis]